MRHRIEALERRVAALERTLNASGNHVQVPIEGQPGEMLASEMVRRLVVVFDRLA
ncbi:hypothetical protein KL953_21695 [Mycolicibacterium goodii]|uniref:hypothetical protein n=1 Tax=Mycolicibacterium goodii TaxID=134601 RepID=UPI001BDBC936|nr:hypothetical protein [Mycolicibacterium goodii]MBU8811499.1 hypothetical protein [Mycolicibacterium goodii]ULN46186.1 hypothetical protein MI170_23195 [Mycolicibacterium goodii]